MSDPLAVAGQAEGARYRPLTDSATEENPVMTPEQAAHEMLSKNAYVQANQKVKMAWGDRAAYRTPLGTEVPRDRTRGQLDRRLPYIGPFPGGFYVQNLRIIRASGQECRIEDVPEVVQTKGRGRDQRGLVEDYRSRDAVANALALMRVMAVRENEMLCEFCLRFDAASVRDKARHIRAEHPEKFDAWLGDATPKKQAAKAR